MGYRTASGPFSEVSGTLIISFHRIRPWVPRSFWGIEWVETSFRSVVSQPAVMREIGFPWSSELYLRSRASVGATLGAARDVLDSGLSGALAGGTHHAHRERGSGFYVFNDAEVTVGV